MSDNAKNHIDKAFYWLNKIPVQDVLVDFMAMVRQELFKAKSLLEEKTEEEK